MTQQNTDQALTCIGHRGAMGYRPENTIAAFELALEMGCRWLELDVHVCDGSLIVIHDDKLERTTSGKGSIAKASLDYVRGLDAGNGQQIPLLSEVIDFVDRRAVINIELKGRGTALPVSALLDDYLARGWQAEDFLLSSFYHDELAAADPKYRRGALFGRRGGSHRVAAAKELDAWSINLDLKTTVRDLVDEAHAAGLKVFVYTVNEPDDIAEMRRLGVDGIFTNFPDRVITSS